MKRVLSAVTLMFVLSALLFGCGDEPSSEQIAGTNEESTDPLATMETTMVRETSEPTVETTSQPTETVWQGIGQYSLEKSLENLTSYEWTRPSYYVLYEDGSFDPYRGEGYYKYQNYTSGHFYGMYLDDYSADAIPIVTDDMKTIVFSRTGFSVELFPVQTTVNAIQYSYGFGTLGKSTDGYYLSVWYPSGKWEDVSLSMIDGKADGDYEPIVYDKQTQPSKGVSIYERTVYYGFQDVDSVTLGKVEGTKVVEKEYEVDAKFYACDPSANNYDETDSYSVAWQATTAGYGELDFSEIPAGQYVMRTCYRDSDNDLCYEVRLITIEH